MGFWSDLFLGEPCMWCGKRSVEEYKTFNVPRHGELRLLWCKSCKKVYADREGYIPKCVRCGNKMMGTEKNSYGVIVPQCTKCGFIWDGDDYDDNNY